METVNRILQEKITARIAPNKAVLIFGARRVGKTVMMRKIVDNYSGRTMMLNGEDYDTLALLENRSIANYRHLLDGIDLLAIDEAQNIPQIGSILKLIVDEIPGISVLASGSSSFDLLNKTGEPLVGRSTQFLLTPFSQREIAQTETADYINGLLRMHAVDEIILYTVPFISGSGRHFFKSALPEQHWTLSSLKSYPNGVCRIIYILDKKAR